jgi:hypothetical protein
MKIQGQEVNTIDVQQFVTQFLSNTQHSKRIESIAKKDWFG